MSLSCGPGDKWSQFLLPVRSDPVRCLTFSRSCGSWRKLHIKTGQNVFQLPKSPVPDYHQSMTKAKKLDLDTPAPIVDEEDGETLAAIDEGIRDADAGRVVPAERVSELLNKWITDSSTPRKR